MKEQLEDIKDDLRLIKVIVFFTLLFALIIMVSGCTPLEKYRIVQEEECWEGEYIPELDVYTGGCNPTGNYIFERIKE